ncbi:deoxyribodipyrimidine photo-lyase [Flaviaesturariibacter flavus]|uniref:Deoxyribodipyrimidine photo-lyase n=1 Tax=Flaviaesturariibacter flavus TaxID=2502780 RepID=A0A4R1BKL3_9BACT|nr:deoxyribodipyrimidine photo-lyase [Flaviaesturariibacter flavus]TCJ17866.1 deoxyribodipyrimidine photo-lyase [Flaviaesturariibacter flavus]
MPAPISIFWFRRDLRLHDNRGLAAALRSGHPVLPVFIFDPLILSGLDADDARVAFIHAALERMQQELTAAGSSLRVFHASPDAAFTQLLAEYSVGAVFTNNDYEPYARKRDAAIAAKLAGAGVAFHSIKDQVLFEKGEVVKEDGKPYLVYTPYWKKWRSLLRPEHLETAASEQCFPYFYKTHPLPVPTLKALGFGNAAKKTFKVPWPADRLLSDYHQTRDLPALAGTTRLGVHLRFGTVSIRALAQRADRLNETFLKELCWREFFMQILWHFPKTQQAFKPAYDDIRWRDAPGEFEKWCAGQTGYPLVDAGMRELAATGFMHNRVRMVAASFLVKHLLIDWRIGEAWFAKKLMDFDLAANNGNWQWVAGCGCDAAPYFRVFNPVLQAQRFDPQGEYIRRWVPEYGTDAYAEPVVEHKFATDRCIAAYKRALNASRQPLFP